MRIDNNISLMNNLSGPNTAAETRRGLSSVGEDRPSSGGIGEQIKSALEHVSDLQQNADRMVEQVSLGNVEDTHKAVISMEKALMALNFTLSVRNKALEAYQEIMRTQM